MLTQENLSKRDYVVVIDKSGSMGSEYRTGSSESRWDHVKESVVALARKCDTLDDDGIDVYTFNSSFKHYNGANAKTVAEIFAKESPMGGTDFLPVMKEVLAQARKSQKPTTVLVVTDGEPSDGVEGQRKLAKLIVETANSLENGDELGIGFIQAGTDPKATAFLKSLDNDLEQAGAKFDIVNSKTCDDLENTTIEQVLLDAVNA